MNDLVIPKELSSKTKIKFWDLRYIVYSIAYWAINRQVLGFFNVDSFIFNVVIPIYTTVIAIMFVFETPFGNAFDIGIKNMLFLFKEKSDNTRLVPNFAILEREVIGKGKKNVKVDISSDKNLKIDKLKDLMGVEEINKTGNINYIKENNYYYTFLKVEIKEIPRLQQEADILASFDEFHSILTQQEFTNLFTLNRSIDLNEYIRNIDELMIKRPKFKMFYMLKKWQVGNGKFNSASYYLTIKTESLVDLEQKVSLMYYDNKLRTKILNDDDFKYVVSKKYDYNIDLNIKEDHVFDENSGMYYKYVLVTNFEQKQKPFFLQRAFNHNFDVTLQLNKVENPSIAINKSSNELVSRLKDGTPESQIKAQNAYKYLNGLIKELDDGHQFIYQTTMVIKVFGSSKEKLDLNYEKFCKLTQSTMNLNPLHYEQEKGLKSFISNDTVIKTGYLVPSKSIAYSYPFNNVSLIQKDGQIKNLKSNSILLLNPLLRDNTTGQDSYDQLIFGNKGAGKSALLKHDMLETMAIYGGNVINLDFDKENEKLVSSVGGKYLSLTNIKINPLEIRPDIFDLSIIQNHIDDVVTLLDNFYTLNFDTQVVLKEHLNTLYHERSIDFKSINFGSPTFPTITDLLQKLKSLDNHENLEAFKFIKDFVTNKPNFSGKGSSDFDFSNQFTGINFSNVKDNQKLLGGYLFWTIKAINQKMRFNKINTTTLVSDMYYYKEILEYEILNNDLSNVIYNQEQLGDYIQNIKIDSIAVESNMRNTILGDIDQFISDKLKNKLNVIDMYQIKYFEHYIKQNQLPIIFLDVLKSLEENCTVDNINELERSLDKNKAFLRITMDESHRVTEIPSVLRFVLKMVKESRKYYAGLTLVDHSPNAFIENGSNDKNQIWGLVPYKLLLNMSSNFITPLVETGKLTRTQAMELKDPLPGQGILMLGDNVHYYHLKLNNEFTSLFDGGK